MSAIQTVRCPTCGSFAERRLLKNVKSGDCIVQTACVRCDYLMVMGLSTGAVIEAYAPGQFISAACRL
ncbi:MAG: replication restart DNA helicase PriA [Cyanobacteria bacterium P01_F01_bin.42]